MLFQVGEIIWIWCITCLYLVLFPYYLLHYFLNHFNHPSFISLNIQCNPRIQALMLLSISATRHLFSSSEILISHLCKVTIVWFSASCSFKHQLVSLVLVFCVCVCVNCYSISSLLISEHNGLSLSAFQMAFSTSEFLGMKVFDLTCTGLTFFLGYFCFPFFQELSQLRKHELVTATLSMTMQKPKNFLINFTTSL